MSYFTTPFGYEEGQHPIEKHRYRLIQSEVCPFAHRTVITRAILGLEDTISLGTVSPIKDEIGWAFTLDENHQDPVLGVSHVKDIYLNSLSDYEGAYAVPILVDENTGKIARKESAEIVRDLIQDFKPFHKKDAPELYPIEKQDTIDKWNQKITKVLLGNVYKMEQTEDKNEFQEAYDEYFNFLDEIDQRLEKQRYMHGDAITETDIYMFTPLVRLDAAYSSLFKVNRKALRNYSNLWPYMKDLYQTKGFGTTTNFTAIQKGYSSSQAKETPTIIDENEWEKPHNREKL